jgi:glucans biosynthesis protein
VAAGIEFRPERRDVVLALAALGLGGPAFAAPGSAGEEFRSDKVDRLARALAGRPFQPTPPLPAALGSLTYDDYRDIRFDRRHALWAGKGSRFIAEPMLRGWLARDRVELFAVEAGRAAPIQFDPARFDFAKRGRTAPDDPATGFSGIRFLSPINRPETLDEIAVFQGASYFRSLGRNQLYGLSARGLALGTGGAAEEFPLFRTLWLERPAGDADSVRIHALLDGPSIAGAYHMTIRPGAATVVEIDARLYPRTTINAAGVAPMSSMFLFGPASPRRFDDFRRAVHDSDGLEMWTGRGERLWRPLTNPDHLRFSAFEDESPRGFGLMQRARAFADYGDLEARYDLRPSLWVEPLDPWGPGSVQLVEIPAADETGDNIAAFWRPRAPWRPGREVRLRYRLHWGDRSTAPDGIGQVIATRAGATVIGGRHDGKRHYAVDFIGLPAGELRADAVTSAGTLSDVRLQSLPPMGGGSVVRASFDLTTPASGSAEMRLRLMLGDRPASETWMTRWTA